MTELKLLISCNTTFKLRCLIDDVVYDYKIVNNNIIIECNLRYGFHKLTITLLESNDAISINDATLDGESLMYTLYMMYTDDSSTNSKRQTTILNERDSTVHLPFINPISHWISFCAEKVPHDKLASRLYEEYEVYYPKPIKIPNSYPKIVQDFFEIDFGFHIHKKINDPYYSTEVPYATIDLNFDFDESIISEELLRELEYLKSIARSPKQTAYTNSKTPWKRIDLVTNTKNTFQLADEFKADPTILPHLYNFFQHLGIDNIAHAFLGILAPKEYIVPHCDTYQEYSSISVLKGCSQLYIPINFKSGNLFKIANVGLIPLDKPLLVNNHNFAHALINDSDEYRFALGIVGSKLNA